MFNEVRCPNPKCDNRIFRKSHDGWKFSVKVFTCDDSGSNVKAVCKSCGTEVFLDLIVSRPMIGTTLSSNSLIKSSSIKPNSPSTSGGGFKIVQIKKT